MASTELWRARRQHHTRSLRIAAVLRLVVLVVMVATTILATPHADWPRQRLLLALADVAFLFAFQLVSTGGYIPLLLMGLVPLIVVPQLSWRQAAVVLSVNTRTLSFAEAGMFTASHRDLREGRASAKIAALPQKSRAASRSSSLARSPTAESGWCPRRSA